MKRGFLIALIAGSILPVMANPIFAHHSEAEIRRLNRAADCTDYAD